MTTVWLYYARELDVDTYEEHEIECRVTGSHGYPARINGPPERCFPEEPPCVELDNPKSLPVYVYANGKSTRTETIDYPELVARVARDLGCTSLEAEEWIEERLLKLWLEEAVDVADDFADEAYEMRRDL